MDHVFCPERLICRLSHWNSEPTVETRRLEANAQGEDTLPDCLCRINFTVPPSPQSSDPVSRP